MTFGELLARMGMPKMPSVNAPAVPATECRMTQVGCQKCGALPGTPCPLQAGPPRPINMVTPQVVELLLGNQKLEPPIPEQGGQGYVG